MQILSWLAGTKIGRSIGAFFLGIVTLSALLIRAFAAGKRKEREKQQNRSLKNLRERKKIDAEIDSLDAATRRKRLRKWARDK